MAAKRILRGRRSQVVEAERDIEVSFGLARRFPSEGGKKERNEGKGRGGSKRNKRKNSAGRFASVENSNRRGF